MKYVVIPVTFAAIALLSSCGGGGGGEEPKVPTVGLKIFVTSEVHNGDFANDPTLPGATAIQKADAFCNRSSSKPSKDNYKALLVDGVNRDAATLTDWVLVPNTAYYQVYNNVLIDVTTPSGTFASFFRNMKNPVACPSCAQHGAWTGIDTGGAFAASTNTCKRWGEAGSVIGFFGTYGTSSSNGGFAFTSLGGYADCVSIQTGLYCVQQ